MYYNGRFPHIKKKENLFFLLQQFLFKSYNAYFMFLTFKIFGHDKILVFRNFFLQYLDL